MHDLEIEPANLQNLMRDAKTIIVRLGKPEILTIRTGDTAQVTEKGVAVAQAIISQKLYFETFEEVFAAVGVTAVMPAAESEIDALATLREHYSAADEYEHGAVAITLTLAD